MPRAYNPKQPLKCQGEDPRPCEACFQRRASVGGDVRQHGHAEVSHDRTA